MKFIRALNEIHTLFVRWYRIFADKRRQYKECSLFKSDCRNILLHCDSIFAATKIIGCNYRMVLPCFPLSSAAVPVENLPGIGRSHFSIIRSPSKSSLLDPILRGVVERYGERSVLTMSTMRSSGESMQIDSSGNWFDRRWSWTRRSIDARRPRARERTRTTRGPWLRLRSVRAPRTRARNCAAHDIHAQPYSVKFPPIFPKEGMEILRRMYTKCFFFFIFEIILFNLFGDAFIEIGKNVFISSLFFLNYINLQC